MSGPETLTDGAGRVWSWSDSQVGYRCPGMPLLGYDEIKSQWGIEIDRSLDFRESLA